MWEYLYRNKNEYFDLPRATQYSGGYIRWIKFFVKAVGEAVKQSSEVLLQYEHVIAKDKKLLVNKGKVPRSIYVIFEYFKRFPISSASYAAKRTGLSFNSTAKAIDFLKDQGILVQMNSNERIRIWEYISLKKGVLLED